jgi:hypothetical protein
MFIVGICALGLRSPEIMQAIGVAGSAQDPAAVTAMKLADVAVQTATHQPMTAAEFAELSRTDPNAYQKYINSHQMQERTEVDKLMNFFARGKFE